MTKWQVRPSLRGLFSTSIAILCAVFLSVAIQAGTARAAPYAAIVLDARTGEVLHSRNADTRLHPASLTKMLTLYIAFEAVEKGEISLDTLVKVSRNAAAEPPSKLGLREGQRIKLRYLIRAAAVKSANDAATAIGEAIEGSESAFAARMNRTAKALGMTNSTFRNMHGLTTSGHLSTARDMANLGRHLFYDYPDYYNLFGRVTTDVPGRTLYNTNRKFLRAYRGADGIKTGYTRAAGFNLVGSAQRGNVRIIAAVFGGSSTPWRNQRMAELLNMGFSRAEKNVTVQRPRKPSYAPVDPLLMSGRENNRVRAVAASLRPVARPLPQIPEAVQVAAAPVVTPPEIIEEGDQGSEPSPAEILARQVAALEPQPVPAAIETTVDAAIVPAAPEPEAAPVRSAALQPRVKPRARPSNLLTQFPAAAPGAETTTASADAGGAAVVTRLTSAGEANWSVNVGRFNTKGLAERAMLTTALAEIETLNGAGREVRQSPRGWDATFTGLTRDEADRTCQRMVARSQTCFMLHPGT
ncbi:D-alanyl-D-alanine carboxypeptidase [Pseudooceanicola sp. HF7]|nr:D-alanyl-D-alanine carboxypeptidase [Pseudooceanicola sp. HF7]